MEEVLNLKQQNFINYYLDEGSDTFGNRVKSYAKAYKLDLKDKRQYKTASANASRLLDNARISKEINDRLTRDKITPEFINSQLYFLAYQSSDLRIKIRALEVLSKIIDVNSSLDQSHTREIVYIPVGDYARIAQQEANQRADIEFPVDPE